MDQNLDLLVFFIFFNSLAFLNYQDYLVLRLIVSASVLFRQENPTNTNKDQDRQI